MISQTPGRTAVAGVLLLVASACAQPARDAAAPAPDSVACAPFTWIGLEGVSERAAMLTPLVIGDTALGFQLDTGSPVSFINRGAVEKHGIEHGLNTQLSIETTVPLEFGVGGFLNTSRVLPIIDGPGDSESVGTIGTDLLRGQFVLIDYPGQRLCIMAADAVPAGVIEQLEFVPAEVRKGRIFVVAEVGGETLENLAFDTGASAFPLQVDLPDWKKITGGEVGDKDNIRVEVPVGGEPSALVGAPATGPLTLGSVRFDAIDVYYREAAPELFSTWSPETDGLLGSALLLPHVVALDFTGDAPRLGLSVRKAGAPTSGD